MKNIIQRIFGINNTQNIFIESKSVSIDIIPQDIEFILDYINENAPEIFKKNPIIVPDLDKKNKLNGINRNQFDMILEDVPLFYDIETSIREDNSNSLKKKYYNAARILNLQYMNKYQKNFPEFVIQVAKTFYNDNTFNKDKTIKLVTLMHYMYHECDLGIKP
ncbi:MAG: hypothetical protein A2086_14745 [Spirochaetes bacterium GWD1_27_9]|nr:MAG: hypothetical protein A2Z98_10025 [Spirochaetes bacterium GWB1_27_13]OHD21095.1 MAG: hypothetical protein A2Y34_06285 [Spirochaetes bacterium GWC1_27_15]OHD34754.1 MAG: hypothetical protein A2086_14745 [Spirochaetes bacterium GWD1_27_9]